MRTIIPSRPVQVGHGHRLRPCLNGVFTGLVLRLARHLQHPVDGDHCGNRIREFDDLGGGDGVVFGA